MFRIFSPTLKHITVTNYYNKNSEKVGSRVNKLNMYSVHAKIWTHIMYEKITNHGLHIILHSFCIRCKLSRNQVNLKVVITLGIRE